MTPDSLLWGIDLGGTKIEIAASDPASPAKPLLRHRCETDSARGYDYIVSRICHLVAEAHAAGCVTKKLVPVVFPFFAL